MKRGQGSFRNGSLALSVLCGLVWVAAAPQVVEAGPEAICVLWRSSGGFEVPHSTYDGATVTVKGIARGGATEYYWDYGDGTSDSWAAIGDSYNLGKQHVYHGLVGQPFLATLHVKDGSGQEAEDTYWIKIYESSDLSDPEQLQIRIDMAIDEGLWWLHTHMNRATYGPGAPGYGQPYGYWDDPGGYPLPATATALDAFQVNGSKANGDYAGDPYVETVQRALNYVLYNTYTFDISIQYHDGNPDDPDTNGNGIGLVANRNGSPTDQAQTYIGGICMTALATCGAPNVQASVGRPHTDGVDYVYDCFYADIVQDMVDFFAYGQVDDGPGRGGWRYYANHNGSDMSTTQWPPLGMIAAEAETPRGMGSTVSQFVRNELINFLNYTQHTACDNDNGGFGYQDNYTWLNCTKTAAGIICHEFLETPLSDPSVESAIGFLYRHWNDTGTTWDHTQLHGNSYGMYGVMKAMRLPGQLDVYGRWDIERITEYDCNTGSQTGNSFDWFYTPAGQTNEGLATYVVNTQQADGSWDDIVGYNQVYDAFCTGWRVLILSPGVSEREPVAVICDCEDQVYNFNQDIHLDGSCSYHTDPHGNIVTYEWDFDYDGTFVPDDTGATTSIVGGYAEEGWYPVALRVTDDSPQPKSDIDVCAVYVHEPPHCPHAAAHPNPSDKTYRGWVGGPVTFDGSASWDPDNEICSYEWDLDNDGLYGAEDDELCFRVGTPDEFCYPGPDGVGMYFEFAWDRPYEGVIGLKVTDCEGEFPTCSDYDWASVEIGNHAPICNAGGPYYALPNATIRLDGTGSYDGDPNDAISYAWDLDNDGDFDDSTLARPPFTVGPDVGVIYDVCLKVTDSFEEYSICCTTVEVVERISRVDATEKGSVLIFPKVELRWDSGGNLIQDTFISLANDFNEDVWVLMYLVSEACNWVDNDFVLTHNEPCYWSVATGLPKGVSPWTVLGSPYPDPEGSGDMVMRGYVVLWAINPDHEEIRWNHLTGHATIVNYADSNAWEYNAYAFQALVGENGDQAGDPGVINLDGVEFDSAFNRLHLDFFASGSTAFSGGGRAVSHDTDLTLVIVDIDLQQEPNEPNMVPYVTKADFEIWNENEVSFSGMEYCFIKWDQSLLSSLGGHFLIENLQTNKGRARIDGVGSEAVCGPSSADYAILGVAAKVLTMDGVDVATGGANLSGSGIESTCILYDLPEPPEEKSEETEGALTAPLGAVGRP